ncbi:MAG: hypothetical protein PWQ41_1200 [Bacillota bacterium]|nr:hypothetical protein [Bacillota bacterium]MDK2925426.1 hypothetical protein [Bacillota bacterium]MDK2959990.1 hypothetical protein [Bacillota bacterium]
MQPTIESVNPADRTDDLSRARALLGSSSLVAVNGERVWRKEGRGIRPLFTLIEEAGAELFGASLADIVVGKAAALLAVFAGFRSVYARTLSKPALGVLVEHGLDIAYENLVPHILNRDKTGFCPLETLTLPIQDPKEAYQAIAAKLAAMESESHR